MKRVTIHAEVVGRRLDDEFVLVHLGTDRIVSLNDTGARIWECLQDEPDVAAVARRLETEFAAAPDSLLPEVEAFVADLAERRFVTIDDA